MTEFKDGKATYRLVSGISTDSHAREIAQRIEMSRQQLAQLLESRGFLEYEKLSTKMFG